MRSKATLFGEAESLGVVQAIKRQPPGRRVIHAIRLVINQISTIYCSALIFSADYPSPKFTKMLFVDIL